MTEQLFSFKTDAEDFGEDYDMEEDPAPIEPASSEELGKHMLYFYKMIYVT